MDPLDRFSAPCVAANWLFEKKKAGCCHKKSGCGGKKWFLGGRRAFADAGETLLGDTETFREGAQTFARRRKTFLTPLETIATPRETFYRGKKTFAGCAETFAEGKKTFAGRKKTFCVRMGGFSRRMPNATPGALGDGGHGKGGSEAEKTAGYGWARRVPLSALSSSAIEEPMEFDPNATVGFWFAELCSDASKQGYFQITDDFRYIGIVENTSPQFPKKWLALRLWGSFEAGNLYRLRRRKEEEGWTRRLSFEDDFLIFQDTGASGHRWRCRRLWDSEVPDWLKSEAAAALLRPWK